MAGEVAKGFVEIEVQVGDSIKTMRQLTAETNAYMLSLNKASSIQKDFSTKYANAIKDVVNSTGAFTAQITNISSAASVMDKTLSKGQATLAQFFSAKFNKNGAMAAEVFGLARERVAALNTQVLATSKSLNGMQEVVKIKPLAEFSDATEVAAQRQQILSTMLKQGTTNLINFGKNVQWAGRQLMVGFTVPLTIFGNTAGRVFMDLEKQVVAFKKVYGDLFTTPKELNQNLAAVTELAKEYTKYGIAVKDTVRLAADAAAAGRQNAELTDAVAQATRLATLGQMDQNSALETTISLQSAFKLSGQDLADTINFLNMVENQTVVSLQDLSAAIPRVAPVIQGLGGDVKDLSVFLAAMQEGGVDAAEGANALKSGLASLINPTKQATQMLSGFGINLDAIIQANKGDLMGTVMAFSQALASLDQFSRQQALEQVFGKFQYAKLGALFDNISREGSQAQQVIATMGYTTEQLGATADKELTAIQESFGVQLTGAIERFKLAIAPIGEIFVKNAIPVLNFFTKIAEGFNNLSDGKKQFLAVATAIVGVVIPAGTMLLGLFMNLVGTITKFVSTFGLFAKNILTGNISKAFRDLGGGAKYLSLTEIDAAIAAEQLSQASLAVASSFQTQATEANVLTNAINRVAAAFGGLSLAQMEAMSTNPEVFRMAGMASESAGKGIKTGGRGFLRRNSGGMIPGSGNTDRVPTLLTPGEFVVNKDAAKNNLGMLTQMNSGGMVPGVQYFGTDETQRVVQAMSLDVASQALKAVSSRDTGAARNKVHPANMIYGMPGGVNQFQNNLGLALDFEKGGRSTGAEIKKAIRDRINSSELLSSEKKVLLKSLSKNQGLSGIKEQRAMAAIMKSIIDDPVQGPYFKGKMSKNYWSRFVIAALFPEFIDRSPKSWGETESGKALVKEFPGAKSFRSQERSPISAIKKLFGTRAQELARAANLESYNSMWGDEKAQESRVISMQKEAEKYGVSGSTFRRYTSPSVNRGIEASHGYRPVSRLMFGLRGRRVVRANNGVLVPGTGNRDTVPAMLTPGEFVVNKEATKNNLGLLHAINGSTKSQSTNGVQKFKLGGLALAGNVASMAMMMSGNPLLSTLGFAASNILPMMMMGRMGAKNGQDTPIKFTEKMNLAMKSTTDKLTGFLKIIGRGSTVAGGTVAAFAALGFGMYKLNKHLAEQEKAGGKLIEAMYGSADRVKMMGDAFGRESKAAAALRIAVEKAGGQYVSQEAQASSSQFMQSDAGKQMIEDINRVKSEGKDAIEALRNQLAMSVVAGVITTEEARAIAIDVGKELKDQKLAIGVSGELTKLLGPDGRDVIKNLSTITAEITPKLDKNALAKDAAEAYKNMNILEKTGQLLMRGGEKGYIESTIVEQISKANEAAFEAEKQALAALNAEYQAGTITSTEYAKGKAGVISSTKKSIDLNAQVLGYNNVEQMLGVAGKTKQLSAGYIPTTSTTYIPGSGTSTTTQTGPTVAVDPRVDNFVKQQKENVRSMLEQDESLTKETVDAMMKDFEKLGDTAWYKLASGEWSGNLDLVLRFTNQGMTAEEIDSLMTNVEILQGIPGIDTIINLNAPNKDEVQELVNSYQKFEGMKNVEKNVYIKDNFSENAKKFGLDYQKILDMPDSAMKTAIMLKVEALANLEMDWSNLMAAGGNQGGTENAAVRQAINAKVKGIVDSINSMFASAGIGGEGDGAGSGGGGEDYLSYLQNRFDLVDKRLSMEAQKYQDIINLRQRQNELDQRNIDINNNALQQLGKQEDAVNKVYDARIKALDEVANQNDRIQQQENSRIDLARALAEGNVSTAAQIMGQITANEANYRIEDTRAALQNQREEDLKNLRVEVNGQLLNREDIQNNIDAIEERIYQRNLSTQELQDKIYQIEQEKLANAREREKVETRMFLIAQRKAIVELQAKATRGTLNAQDKASLVDFRNGYNSMVDFFNATFGESLQRVMYGGKIKKYAFGGMTYKGSNEPPPTLKMRLGSVVPGMGNVDRVPALLTPGEFVVRKTAAQANMPLLEAINNGSLTSPRYNVSNSQPQVVSADTQINSSTVYNDTYNISVNVAGTNASPDDIANVVLSKLSQTNSGNVRSFRR